MTDAAALRTILDHARAAAGAGRLAAPQAAATVDNPLCGDRVTIELSLTAGRITAFAQRTRGCVLCEAAASLIGKHAPGRSPADLHEVATAIAAMLREGGPVPEGWPDLAAFDSVRETRPRHDCVLLPFQALDKALSGLPAGETDS